MYKKIALSLALAVVLTLPAGLSQAAYIEFASLLGTGFSAAGGSATGYSLNSYGLSGYSMDFYGQSWYSAAAGTWVPGSDPGVGAAAGMYMVSYKGDYGLAVGVQAPNAPLNNLPGTGVNEIDARESLLLTFSAPVVLNSITLGNFFNDAANLSVSTTELGWVVLDNGYAAPISFFAPVGQFVGASSGTYVVNLPPGTVTSSLRFFAADYTVGESWSSDYLVRGVDVSAPTPSVPEPASLVLFGSAAGLMGWLRRRRRKA
ncbi:MAG: PEP-CTERM sorting domain-containing protein [Pseudomonadota bacterium]